MKLSFSSGFAVTAFLSLLCLSAVSAQDQSIKAEVFKEVNEAFSEADSKSAELLSLKHYLKAIHKMLKAKT